MVDSGWTANIATYGSCRLRTLGSWYKMPCCEETGLDPWKWVFRGQNWDQSSGEDAYWLGQRREPVA